MHVSIRAASNELSRRPVLVSPHETVVIVFPDDPNRFRRELDEEENWVSKEMSGRDERTGFYYCISFVIALCYFEPAGYFVI